MVALLWRVALWATSKLDSVHAPPVWVGLVLVCALLQATMDVSVIHTPPVSVLMML
jgi:hypothetical protein